MMDAVKTTAPIKRHKKLSAFDIVNLILLSLLCLTFLYPFYNILVYAFNDGQDAMKGVLYLWPREITLDNFKVALAQDGLLNAVKISVLRTVIGTFFTVIGCSSLGYAMSKRQLPGYKAFMIFFFITFIFNGGMIPYFLTIKELGLYNTFWIYVIPGAYGYWNMILFRSFFDSIPASIEESAKIDGASYLYVFFKLIIPLSKPVFATIVLFTAVGHWNDWFAGTFYVKDQDLIPLQTLLQNLMTEANMLTKVKEMGGSANMLSQTSITPYSIRLAIVVITVVPIIMVYPFLQKYIVKGMMVGAVKG